MIKFRLHLFLVVILFTSQHAYGLATVAGPYKCLSDTEFEKICGTHVDACYSDGTVYMRQRDCDTLGSSRLQDGDSCSLKPATYYTTAVYTLKKPTPGEIGVAQCTYCHEQTHARNDDPVNGKCYSTEQIAFMNEYSCLNNIYKTYCLPKPITAPKPPFTAEDCKKIADEIADYDKYRTIIACLALAESQKGYVTPEDVLACLARCKERYNDGPGCNEVLKNYAIEQCTVQTSAEIAY